MEATKREQLVTVIAVGVLLAGGAIAGIAQFHIEPGPVVIPMPMASATPARLTAAPVAAPEDPAWRTRFDAVYSLEEGQVLKHIMPPYIPERDRFFHSQVRSASGSAVSASPSYMIMRWTGENVQLAMIGSPGTVSRPRPVASLLNSLGISPSRFDVPPDMAIDIKGDWIIRDSATDEQKLEAIAPILSEVSGRKIRFQRRPVEVWQLVAE